MELRKITAIIRSTALQDVEQKLRSMHVPGLSTTRVKGYGEYSNFFSRDPKVLHARIEIFAEKGRAEVIARAIVEAARTGTAGDGLVAILPVERIWRIRTGHEATEEEVC
jgi:nitrogen regulatory protein P-II 1